MAKTFLEFDAGELFTNINKQFAKNIKREIIPLIVETIQRGISPVKGETYVQYSPEYRDRIKKGKYREFGKRTRPVNLTLSGKMLRAFKVRPLRRGGVTIFNTNELAKYHNDLGAGRGKVIRKMLPTNPGQRFKPLIQKAIDEELDRAVKKSQRK